jgi:hypothetical protein
MGGFWALREERFAWIRSTPRWLEPSPRFPALPCNTSARQWFFRAAALGAYEAGLEHAPSEANCEPNWVWVSRSARLTPRLSVAITLKTDCHPGTSSGTGVGSESLGLYPRTATGFEGCTIIAAPDDNRDGPARLFRAAISRTLVHSGRRGGSHRLLRYECAQEHLGASRRFRAAQQRADACHLWRRQCSVGQFHLFRQCERDPRRHIVASGALPPAVSAIRIEGEYYGDGGCVSNTPLQYLLEQKTI